MNWCNHDFPWTMVAPLRGGCSSQTWRLSLNVRNWSYNHRNDHQPVTFNTFQSPRKSPHRTACNYPSSTDCHGRPNHQPFRVSSKSKYEIDWNRTHNLSDPGEVEEDVNHNCNYQIRCCVASTAPFVPIEADKFEQPCWPLINWSNWKRTRIGRRRRCRWQHQLMLPGGE